MRKFLGPPNLTNLCQFYCENLRVNETGHIFGWMHGEVLPFFLQDFSAAIQLKQQCLGL